MVFDALLAVSLAAGPGPVDLTTVASGLNQPTSVVSAPNGTLFVTEKPGRIVKIADGKAKGWFRVKGVSTSGERGLLSMARIDAKRFYAAYTDRKGALQVSRFRKGGGERKIIRIPHPEYDNHNGGQVQLHDGLLYISTGDGGGSGDPFRAAGRLGDLRGKLLRVDPTCGKRYCIPASNPRRSPVIAKGLRNAWRFSIDAPTGTIWIADVGQNAFEEVNRMPLNGPLRDFGWSCREARSTYNRDACAGRSITRPVIVYSHASGDGESITGGYVYRGESIPSLQGWYVFGDFISGNVWAWRDGTRERIAQADRLTSFGLTETGELLLTTIDGRLLRMAAG
jgi:glucose/arabinose dehydrogenase